MPIQLIALIAAAALVVGGLSSRSGDPASEPAPASPPPAAPVASETTTYCELSAGLDQAGNEAFEELEQSPNPSRKDFERAEAAFLRDHAQEIDALVAAAPAPIHAQVELLIESIRARAGARTAPLDRQTVLAAEDSVEKWERANCP